MKIIYNIETKVILGKVSDQAKTYISRPAAIFQGTDAECKAKIIELGLADSAVKVQNTRSKKASEFFLSQPEEARAPFQNVFTIISSLDKDVDKATMIAALAVPAELEPVRTQLISILTQ